MPKVHKNFQLKLLVSTTQYQIIKDEANVIFFF